VIQNPAYRSKFKGFHICETFFKIQNIILLEIEVKLKRVKKKLNVNLKQNKRLIVLIITFGVL